MPTVQEYMAAGKRAIAAGDIRSANEIAEALEAEHGPQGQQSRGAMTRAIEAGIANLSSLGDLTQGLGQEMAETSALPPGTQLEQGALANQAVQRGLTTPQAFTDTDLASLTGRALSTAPFGMAGSAARVLPEVAAAFGSAGGEFLGREAFGDVGGLVGSIGGAAATGLLGKGIRAGGQKALGGAGRFARAQAMGESVGANIGVGEIPGASGLAMWIDRTSARIPGGIGIARRRAARLGIAVATKADDLATRLAGTARDPELAGGALRRGFKSAQERMNVAGGKLWDRARDLTQGVPVTPRATQKVIGQMVKESSEGSTAFSAGFNQETAAIVQQWATNLDETLIKSGGSLTGRQLHQIRKVIGKDLSDVGVFGTPREGALKRLYGAISDDLKEVALTADKASRGSGKPGSAIVAWGRANKFWEESQRELRRIHRSVINKATDTEIFNAAQLRSRQGPEILRDIKKRIPRKEWEMATGMMLRKMGMDTPGARTAIDLAEDSTQAFSMSRFLTNWNKMDEARTLDVVFGGKVPKAEIRQIAEVAQGARELQNFLPNPSGTAAASASIQTAGAAAAAVSAGFVVEAVKGISAVVGAGAFGQFMVSNPTFARWLAASTRMPVGQLPQHIEALGKVLEREPEARPVAEEIVSQLRP